MSPAGLGGDGPCDLPASRRILGRRVLAAGRVQSFVSEEVELPGAGVVVREFTDHPGAVAIMAMDDAGRVLLQRQYRHPVRSELWEPPAGLLDEPGEAPLAAAKRELAEEADLLAQDWRRLIEFYTTPGGCNERIAVFLARGLSKIPVSDQFSREDEESDLVPVWIDLEEAAARVMDGSLVSPTATVGILALSQAARTPAGLDALPPAE
ncbi:MAG: NUDIX hydrolase [Bifidobacteriaceae bacterium]|nr:NUDIX hydrolase [Bifidobacteriaceae bacterium]